MSLLYSKASQGPPRPPKAVNDLCCEPASAHSMTLLLTPLQTQAMAVLRFMGFL